MEVKRELVERILFFMTHPYAPKGPRGEADHIAADLNALLVENEEDEYGAPKGGTGEVSSDKLSSNKFTARAILNNTFLMWDEKIGKLGTPTAFERQIYAAIIFLLEQIAEGEK